MVETERIVKYLKDLPGFMKNPDTLLLREAIKKYPYFNSLYILLAMAKNQTDSIFTKEYLQKAAIYSGQRSQFKNHLNPENLARIKRVVKSRIDKPAVKKEVQIDRNKENRDEVSNIIDRFIKTSPSIQKPKVDFYSPTEAASRSISEEDQFVTETLAKIHVRQKNYPKAIEIYERLSLIYPEKSDYFAHLINGLKTKINE
jgi:tetratricopeptide (TPR) repeat protein